MTTNTHGLSIKARRWYATQPHPALNIRSETLYVTGFAAVTVGLGVNERTERWCRVREEGARRALGLLVHPDAFVVALQ
jgi:hypothetical protein